MKRSWTKKLCVGLLTGALMVVGAVAADGVVTENPSIGGGAAHLVYAQMGGNRSVEVVLAGNSVFRSAGTDTLINQAQAQGTVVAAVNGTYFTEYGGGSARMYGTIMQNGVLQNGMGEQNMLGVTWDGKAYIDRVTYATRVKLSEKTEIGMWAVNDYYTTSGSIVLLTPAYTKSVTVPSGGKVYTIRDGKVVSEAGAGSYTVPSDANLMVFNADAVTATQRNNELPSVGGMAIVSTRATACKRSADLNAWNDMRTVTSGGRMLLQNGYNVARDASYNGTINESPQGADYVAARGFVATMSDGRLVLGVATSASMYQIAEYLKGQGAVNALGLDGGASGMLYMPNNYLMSAGRQLSSVIAIVDKNSAPQKPINQNGEFISQNQGSGQSSNQGSQADPDPNPSLWARETVKQCIALGLIPEWLQCNYRNDLNREEFCELILTLIEKKTGMTIDEYRGSKKLPYAAPFKDSDGWYVRECASFGIVEGTGDNYFQPEASLTREQAATILKRAAEVLGASTTSAPKSFGDADKISSWAKESIDFITAVGIMQGTGVNFSPQNNYTREQAFVTMLNAYNKIKN